MTFSFGKRKKSLSRMQSARGKARGYYKRAARKVSAHKRALAAAGLGALALRYAHKNKHLGPLKPVMDNAISTYTSGTKSASDGLKYLRNLPGRMSDRWHGRVAQAVSASFGRRSSRRSNKRRSSKRRSSKRRSSKRRSSKRRSSKRRSSKRRSSKRRSSKRRSSKRRSSKRRSSKRRSGRKH